MDIPFARKVLEFVEIEHEDIVHKQRSFYWTPAMENAYTDAYGERSGYLNECKTAACIAGTACLLAPNVEFVIDGCDARVWMDGEQSNWLLTGQRLLGITSEMAESLFWNMNDRAAVEQLRTMITEAEAAELHATERKL
jgi:hypothetical protein